MVNTGRRALPAGLPLRTVNGMRVLTLTALLALSGPLSGCANFKLGGFAYCPFGQECAFEMRTPEARHGVDLAVGSLQSGLAANLTIPFASTNFANMKLGVKSLRIWSV